MNIEELNKLIQEELKAYLNENEEEVVDDEAPEEEGEEIEVTTDEPEEEEGPLDTLRQIYDMLKPIVEPEEEAPEVEADEEAEEAEEEGEEEEEVEEAVGYPNYRADQVRKATHSADDVNQGLNESFDSAARFKKLANIK